jgi:hypothetical protein
MWKKEALLLSEPQGKPHLLNYFIAERYSRA